MSGRKRSSRDRPFNHPFDTLAISASNLILTLSFQLLPMAFVLDFSRGLMIVRCFNRQIYVALTRLLDEAYCIPYEV